MPLILLFAFIVVPLIELWAIGQVNGLIGLGPTLLLLLADSLVGAVLVRREGARAWREFREALGAGRVPGDELLGGVLLLMGGALLLTPGFVTDGVGLALVLPVTRRPIARLITRRGVPVQWQVGTTMWNSTRPPAGVGQDDVGGERPEGRRPGDVTDGPSIEVVNVERDEDPTLP